MKPIPKKIDNLNYCDFFFIFQKYKSTILSIVHAICD
jgi:hypothetical protein